MLLNISETFKEPTEIKIRFNTVCNDDFHYWRIILRGKEHLASNIVINSQVYTTKDVIPGIGDKWHVSTMAKSIDWDGDDVATIN